MKNPMPDGSLPDPIATVNASLRSLGAPVPEPAPEPAINPKRSVQADYIVCLEDGKRFKSPKRHVMTHYGLTPEECRLKWGLPNGYPMVAPASAAARSDLAKEMGLGRKPKSKPQARRRRT